MGTNSVGLPPNSVEESSTATPQSQDERQFQRDAVAEIERVSTPLVEGEIWYLISSSWYKRWKEYTLDIATFKPGPIENNSLIDQANGRLNKYLSENIDFLVISKKHWETLLGWYGGGPEIPRKATANTSLFQTSIHVEIYPLSVRIVKSTDINTKTPVIEHFSKSDTVGALKTRMCEKLGLDPEKIRVWDYYSGSYMKLLTEMNQRLDSAQILDDQLVLLEEKNADGTWPERVGTSYSRTNYSSSYSDQVPTTPGQTGLSNLGNTCFMNSAIQCLSNTVPMRQYLVSGEYSKDVNHTNPLGMKGELAEQFANLLKELWAGTYSAVAPREFKSKLERFAPQFAGYQQQDSQELLAFLLDGLHEDLNRVKQKPYIEGKDFPDGTPDSEIANESWRTHLARNNSVIVDWFHGQYKSTLICPDCKKISITFDPFMYLSLPIPQKTTRRMQVTLLRQAPKYLNPAPVKYGLTVPKNGTVADLKVALREKAGLEKGTDLAIADVYNSRFFKSFTDGDLLEIIQERDVIFAYELVLGGFPFARKELGSNENSNGPIDNQMDGEASQPAAPKKDKDGDVQISDGDDDQDVVISLLLRYEEQIHSIYYGNTTVRRNAFGIPRMLKVPSRLTREELYAYLLFQLHQNLNLNSLPAREKAVLKQHISNSNTPSSTNHQQNENTTTTDQASEMDIDQQNNQEEEKELFHILFVDNNGGNEVEPQGDEISFATKRSLAISWPFPIWKKYYTESSSDIVSDESVSEEQQRDENGCSLQKCLDLFTTVEKLGPDDPWYCNRCKEFRQATKKFDLWQLPSLLVIHLKRFSYRNRFWRDRLDTLIDFPMTGLDLSSHVINPETNKQDTIYDLYAVSNHYGSMAGGHYTAYAKNETGKWFRFDDRTVSPIDESTVKSTAAYVLFYQRRGSFPPAQEHVQTSAHDQTSSSVPASAHDQKTNGLCVNPQQILITPDPE